MKEVPGTLVSAEIADVFTIMIIDYTFRDEVFPIFNHIAFFYTFEGGIVP